MRIAMFSDYFFPELGGIQDSIAITARALGARGHEVDLFVPRYGRRDYRRVGSARQEPDLGRRVRVHRRFSVPFPSSTQQSRAALPSLLSWSGLRGRRPDVIHVHSFFGVGLEALLVGRLLGIPVIGTNHTTVAGLGPHLPVSVARATAFVVWFYNRCDRITAPSRSVFADLGPTGLRPEQIVVSNPIDTALFAPAGPEQREALKRRLGLGPLTITYAGRLGAEKNIEVVLRAVAAMTGDAAQADIALAGHGSHEAALRNLAAELGLAARVRFFGTLRPAALAELFQASDMFTMMSTSETQSMAMLQAMACGLPVVAADARALPEFVTPDTGVLADPHDSAALAHTLSDLLARPDRCRTLAMGGRRHAEACSITATTDSWEAIYRSVIQGSLGN